MGLVKLESDQRFPDHISLGVSTRVFPPDSFDEVLVGCDPGQPGLGGDLGDGGATLARPGDGGECANRR